MMGRASRIASAVVAGLTASSLLAPSGAMAAAASPGWRIVLSRHYGQKTADSGYGAVVAPRPSDAWVFGGSCSCAAGHPVAEHWNGTRWSAVTLPTGLTGTIAAASAPSVSDIWAVSAVNGYVLHWNGSRWSVALRLKESGYPAQFTGVTAFSSRNVWVFGGVINGETGLVGLGTWHFNGTTWTKVQGQGSNVVQASALSASDIWGVGGIPQAYDGVEHFNGETWQRVSVPRSAGFERFVLAVSPREVWVDGDSTSTPTARPTLIRWNGTSWHGIAVEAPPGANLLYQISPDGHGGIWIEAESSATGRFWMLHRSATGTWASSPLGPAGTFLNDYALVPGTQSLWGAGQSYSENASNAVIWAYGTAG